MKKKMGSSVQKFEHIKTQLRIRSEQVVAVGLMTFRELLREKILWSSFVFAILAAGLSYSISRLSFAESSRIALDFGLASISIVGGLISIIMGSALIAREVENRTVYLMVTKAMARWQFVLGRVLGLMMILSLNSVLMILAVTALVLLSGGRIDGAVVKSLFLQVTEFAVLASVASVFSSFSTAGFAAIVTAGVWVIGHTTTDLEIMLSKIEPEGVQTALQWLARLLPDLNRFDVKGLVSHGLLVTWEYTFASFAYGLLYGAFALIAACLIFSRRDL